MSYVVLLFFSAFVVVYVDSLSMRTKCRAVRGPNGGPMLEDDLFVSGVAVTTFANPLRSSSDLLSVRCPNLEEMARGWVLMLMVSLKGLSRVVR